MMGKVIMSGIVPTLKAPVTGVLASSLAVGSTVKLMESGTAVEYLVVNQGIPSNSSLYDSSCNGTWLLRKDIRTRAVWNANTNAYADSSINTWLHSTYFNSLGSVEQEVIKQVQIPYCVGNGGTTINSGANGLSVKAFLLSGYEVGWTTATNQYFPIDGAVLDYFKGTAATDSKRSATYNGSAAIWWLRSPVSGGTSLVFYVRSAGGQSNESPSQSRGIRPAVILPSNALFDEATMLLKGVA